MESSILSVSLVDLPGLIQSIASRRRSGVLTVRHKDNSQERRVRFGGGMINAVTGGDPDAFGKALVWAGVLTLPQYHASLLRVGDHCPPEKLLKALVNAKVITPDGVLDALDCYIEEEFTTILGWQQPELSFNEVIIADEWGVAQAKTGLAVNPGSMLLESLRRQDELGTIAELIPDQWDALFRVPSVASPDDLHADAKHILSDWTDGTAVNAILDHPTLPPFRSKLALGILFRHGLLRVANVNELVVEADAAYANGYHQNAYGLYRRTLGYGMDNARIHMHLAELAERFGDNAAAATSFMAAAQQMSDPNATVVALRNALRLGADKEAVLTQMVALNLQLGSDADSVASMLMLAEFYGEKGSYQQAIQSVREAQGIGADRGTTALMIARFSRSDGDTEQAALQLELAARAFHENDRTDQAINAWRELLKLLPGRCEYAKECAELLVWTSQKAEAIAVLRAAIASQKEAGEDILLQIYELLSQLDPADVDAHDWLASAYERRRDRDGATKQLRLSAQAQEKAKDFAELAQTLERIVELGGEKIENYGWLARTRVKLRQESLASDAYCNAIDAALALGLLKEARPIIETALESLPASMGLRVRLAQVANREGDRTTAIKQFLAAAELARGAGALEVARDMLVQACRLRPDDLSSRVRLAEVAEELKDQNLDAILSEVVNVAVRSTNHGIALEHARKRIVATAGTAYEPRLELLELLRLCGDTTGQLATGKQLLMELLEQGEFEKAVEVLSRLVASHPKNSELVLQLAEVYAALGDERQAFRFYKHVIPLLQLDDKAVEARAALDLLEGMCDEHELPGIAQARDRLDKGQVIDWDKIRRDLELGQRRKAVGRVVQPGLD